MIKTLPNLATDLLNRSVLVLVGTTLFLKIHNKKEKNSIKERKIIFCGK